jgi:hypothetical protein
MNFLKKKRYGFRLGADARLPLIVKWAIQTTGVEIYLHAEISYASRTQIPSGPPGVNKRTDPEGRFFCCFTPTLVMN